MSEMVERVARALCGSEQDWEFTPESVINPREGAHGREDYRRFARAAIEAMREPTTFMLGDTSEPDVRFDFMDERLEISEWHEALRKVYGAMIDAALKDDR